jgi:hypothetical protein
MVESAKYLSNWFNAILSMDTLHNAINIKGEREQKEFCRGKPRANSRMRYEDCCPLYLNIKGMETFSATQLIKYERGEIF